MQLTKLGLLAVRNTDGLRQRIAEVEKVKVSTVERWMRNNSTDLTKAGVLVAIKAMTGLTDEQLLESVAQSL